MQLEPEDLEKLAAFRLPAQARLTIELLSSGDARSRRLEDFCRLLSQNVPGVEIRSRREDTETSPWFRVGAGVYYQAVPTGRELAPFLEILQALAEGKDLLAPGLRRELETLAVPVRMRLHISARCAFCPAAVRQLLPLASWGRTVRLHVIDVALFPEMAREDAVRAVPTLVLDRDLRWSGSMPLDEVVQAIVRQDPCNMGVSVLRGMLEEGRAARVAEIMVACGEVLPALVPLLLHPKWPVRLGAMVTVEWVAEKAPDLAARVVSRLWEDFGAADDAVRGDIVYLSGEFGDGSWKSRLREVERGDRATEVREAATEAVEKLESAAAQKRLKRETSSDR